MSPIIMYNTISEKTNDSILRTLSDGRTDGRTDGWTKEKTDQSDFIGRYQTNVEHPKGRRVIS